MIRLAAARACRLFARLGLGWGEWWAGMAERLEGGAVKLPVRGVGA